MDAPSLIPDPFLFAMAFGASMVGMGLERVRHQWMRLEWRAKRRNGLYAVHSGPPITDAAEQLRVVTGAEFQKRRLLSKTEAQVMYAAENAIREAKLGWRVMAQVSLGEVLSSKDKRAYSAINSKRVDLLVVSRSGEPIVAIEYQGGGHYQGSAAARDAVKKEALRKAGIRYHEVTPEHGPKDLAREISRIAKVEQLKQPPPDKPGQPDKPDK